METVIGAAIGGALALVSAWVIAWRTASGRIEHSTASDLWAALESHTNRLSMRLAQVEDEAAEARASAEHWRAAELECQRKLAEHERRLAKLENGTH